MGRKGLMLLVAAVLMVCFVVGCASSKPWGSDTIDKSATKTAPK